jgi:hypothetical protein
MDSMSTLVNVKAKMIKELTDRNISYISMINDCQELHWSIENNVSKLILTKFKQGIISLDELKSKAIAKVNKALDKQAASLLAYITALENATDFKGGSVSIEWKKSANWGANPNCKFSNNSDYTNYFSGSISGCGYDKESTAMAQAFNQCDSLVKLVLLGFENGILTKENAYGVSCEKMPFQGGVGTNCFISSLKKLGWNMKKVGSGKTFDCWDIVPL